MLSQQLHWRVHPASTTVLCPGVLRQARAGRLPDSHLEQAADNETASGCFFCSAKATNMQREEVFLLLYAAKQQPVAPDVNPWQPTVNL